MMDDRCVDGAGGVDDIICSTHTQTYTHTETEEKVAGTGYRWKWRAPHDTHFYSLQLDIFALAKVDN